MQKVIRLCQPCLVAPLVEDDVQHVPGIPLPENVRVVEHLSLLRRQDHAVLVRGFHFLVNRTHLVCGNGRIGHDPPVPQRATSALDHQHDVANPLDLERQRCGHLARDGLYARQGNRRRHFGDIHHLNDRPGIRCRDVCLDSRCAFPEINLPVRGIASARQHKAFRVPPREKRPGRVLRSDLGPRPKRAPCAEIGLAGRIVRDGPLRLPHARFKKSPILQVAGAACHAADDVSLAAQLAEQRRDDGPVAMPSARLRIERRDLALRHIARDVEELDPDARLIGRQA